MAFIGVTFSSVTKHIPLFYSGSCGGNYSGETGYISSPSYPKKYPANADCIYTISQPTGSIIQLNFLVLDLGVGFINDSCYDYIEIRDGPSKVSPSLARLCGGQLPGFNYSTQNHVWIR